MPPNRTAALDHLQRFLLVDGSFPPLMRDHSVCRAVLSEARSVERAIAGAVPGWHPQTFPRGLLGKPTTETLSIFSRWLAAYRSGLDAGIHGVTALVEPEHATHQDRWMLAYDLGARLASGT